VQQTTLSLPLLVNSSINSGTPSAQLDDLGDDFIRQCPPAIWSTNAVWSRRSND
jgi:hypothetical protein